MLEEDKVFDVVPFEGVIDSGEAAIIVVKFNPYQAGDFEKSLSLYLDDDRATSYLEIRVRGQGTFPKITFDRREVILPPVPLGIYSRCVFQIVNEGYENLNLKHNIPQDLGAIPLEINYIEGKNLGVTKPKLKIEVCFMSPRTMSFTTKIQFFDDQGRIYSVPISGTTDNCILTTFSYMQRSLDEFKITCEEESPIMLVDDFDNDSGYR